MLINTTPQSVADARQKFRYYSRQIINNPNDFIKHEQRISSALLLEDKEPLQGALADLFYGCWYDMPILGPKILSLLNKRLHPQVKRAFARCVAKEDYLEQINELATRWSVLVTPTMNVETHRLRTSPDDSKRIAHQICEELLDARYDEDLDAIQRIETEFFSHCLACDDRMAFSIVWFRLTKEDWEFDERWLSCQYQLEQR